MPLIHALRSVLEENLCPPGRPFCDISSTGSDDGHFNDYKHSSANTRFLHDEDVQRSYAALIFVFTLATISLLLWLCLAHWPRSKVKSLWTMVKGGEKKSDKGIHSPEPQRNDKLRSKEENVYSKSIVETDITELEIDDDFEYNEREQETEKADAGTK